MSVLSLLVASCPILATLNLELERKEVTSALSFDTRSAGRKLGIMAYPLADKSWMAEAGRRGTEVERRADVKVRCVFALEDAVECEAGEKAHAKDASNKTQNAAEATTAERLNLIVI